MNIPPSYCRGRTIAASAADVARATVAPSGGRITPHVLTPALRFIDYCWRLPHPAAVVGSPCASAPLVVLSCNATSSLCHQRDVGRLRRSWRRFHGRRTTSFLGRETRRGRCPALWQGHLRNDAGRVAVAGRWAAATMDGPVDGTL